MSTAEDTELARALDAARRVYWEDPDGSLATAITCQETARNAGDANLLARALALNGAITLHRGDLRGAMALARAADELVAGAGDDAQVEIAALQGHLAFFSGSYVEAVAHADRSIDLADRNGDADLRIFARRSACLVLGNVGNRRFAPRLEELLELSIASGNRWEEAVSRNDKGCLLSDCGDQDAASEQLEAGLEIARGLAPDNGFVMGLLLSTRADVRLRTDRPAEALADAEESIARMCARGEPNPYVFGVTVRAQVQALLALGRLDDAQRSGEGALSRLGDRVPQARSLILSTVASALREAGRIEDAYDTLARCAALEREAFQELSELQRGLERATLEASAARREADLLAAKNRELEALRDRLREQADRDWLTGLHNRRFLARELERLTGLGASGNVSLAVLDLDHFKAVNDDFGHDVGDRVLVRVAGLLLDRMRAGDAVVRTGGEEFVLLMPATDARAAAACCERLRTAISGEPWDRLAAGLTVSASVGVATAPDAADLEALARLADRRMYAAKRAGRDRVVAT